ncbi:Chemotaxis protein CheA [Jannaschia seosinensis]|uniref:Chemotaxis protein CheA n=1 Tax=Jannaschia seosinensis TaxID=313367 RepID=A0A0M7BCA2_9RHOB|nr:chemotaxis protein CheA [Jannaschia seosinensis]CUH39819.1 Chemotaxis protein CheA [Jannaschia seosinensis]
MNAAVDSFVEEATDILDGLEKILLELEADPTNTGTVDAVFRALHTLKGSGAMFGFASLARFTHPFENAYEQIREGTAKVTPEIIQLSLASRDHLQRIIAKGPDAENSDIQDPTSLKLVEKIDVLIADQTTRNKSTGAIRAHSTQSQRFLITFKPHESDMRNGMRPDLLLAELEGLGEAHVTCSAAGVPPLRELDPTVCHFCWTIELTTSAGRDAIDEVFIFASDSAVTVTPLAPDTIDMAISQPAPGMERNAIGSGRMLKSDENLTAAPPKSDSVRVQAHRLDELMDQLGELVITQARLNRISADLDDTSLAETTEEIERLVTGLRDATLSIRMLPIELVFGKFRRVARDLSAELGKHVQLLTRGGETEVDKNVIDSLTEPLVHIIRNSIDHGVEAPDARLSADKPERATIVMQARQSGGEVLISVSDDGAGLNAEAIRQRAVSRKLIDEDQEVTDEQLHQLIFEPGFSTAEAVSSVSGRGVGMDAVRRVIDDLRGTVEVKSQPGRGTEVTLRLPLTLAIIDGLLVRVGNNPFVMPLSTVEECVELPPDETARQSGRSILRIRNKLVPFLRLDTLFGFERVENDDRRVVITSVDGRRLGFVVDEVIGQHQTVIKPLSVYHRGIEGLAGSTILGDGSVALILDAAAIVKRAQAAVRTAA